MFMPTGILSIVTPIINIYYIRPYCEAFKRCLLCRPKLTENSRSKVDMVRP
ncbi:hypothetical protein NECAME_14834 [Necator americanus]|uniref:Uncharacterized protein n=1 Tax=Necator americanus TaxID=51031 RepID=W2SND0_NECAM|nr:hypothetical protein NECAME_14834 [Necator americanus]ETN70341.1 hypothetical protein NECAME_14834 [Necator americanus]